MLPWTPCFFLRHKSLVAAISEGNWLLLESSFQTLFRVTFFSSCIFYPSFWAMPHRVRGYFQFCDWDHFLAVLRGPCRSGDQTLQVSHICSEHILSPFSYFPQLYQDCFHKSTQNRQQGSIFHFIVSPPDRKQCLFLFISLIVAHSFQSIYLNATAGGCLAFVCLLLFLMDHLCGGRAAWSPWPANTSYHGPVEGPSFLVQW